METGFQFALPPATLAWEEVSGQITYRLRVQKQPGTKAIPISIKVMLPDGAALLSMPTESVSLGTHLWMDTHLQTDVELEVVFTPPQTGQNP